MTSPTTHATGDRSIAVGRDAVASIFATGDHNQFFIGPYRRLTDAYQKPWSLYEELGLDRFTGRQWLLRRVDEFLGGNDRGYFILEGDVGVGKTTFLAWLAARRGYVHHFVNLLNSERDVRTALRSLCAQLIRTWDLDSRAIGGVLPSEAEGPQFFYDTLHEAAQRRDELRPGEPIVLVVDGLNEVEPAPSPHQNVLTLPASLPAGVYFVVSQRSTYVPLAVKVPRRVAELSATSPENLDDMRAFLSAAASRPEIRQVLDRQQVTAGAFVDTLMQVCGGVWIYLYYLMAEIESGARPVTDLDTLPAGLWQYYAQYWRSWQQEHPDDWKRLHEPLLATIVAARELLPASLLAELAGVDDVDEVTVLLDESWRPFLQVDPSGEEYRYGIFNTSLREFMEGRVDTAALTSADRAVVRRSAASTSAAHVRICERYLDGWGGLDAGVPRLRDPGAASQDGGYGLRHLAEHLIASGREADLHRLLWIGWGSDSVPDAPGGHVVNAWREAHERAATLSGYLNDVTRAWALAEASSRQALAAAQTPSSIRLELRYALLAASVSSLAANIPPALLLELLRRGSLPPDEALAYARRGPDPLGRSEALLALGTELPEPARSETLREALAAVPAIDDEQWRTGALARIVPYLSEPGRADAESVARTVVDPYWRVAALRTVAELLGKGGTAAHAVTGRDPGDESWYSEELALPHALAVAHAIEQRHTEALARLTARLPSHPTDDDLQRAVESVERIPHDRYRAEALTALAARLPGDRRDAVLDEALAAARAVGDSEEHGRALAALAAQLALLDRPADAVAVAGRIPDHYRRAHALAHLVGSSPGPSRSAARQAALEALRDIGSDVLRARVLIDHPGLASADVPHQGPDPAVLATIRETHWRAAVVAALCPSLGPEAARDALNDVLDTAAALPDGHRRADLLLRVVPSAIGPLLTRVQDLADDTDPEGRDRLWAALAPRLAEDGRTDRAVATVAGIGDEYWRAAGSLRLTAALAREGRPAEAVEVARSIPYAHWRAEALGRLAARVGWADARAAEAMAAPRETAEDDWRAEAMAAAREAADDGWRAEAIGRVAASLPDAAAAPAFAEALEVAHGIAHAYTRWYALAAVAVLLAGAGRGEESLAQIDAIEDDFRRADTLVRVASLLPGHLLRDALDRAYRITHHREQARVLGALLQRFGDGPPEELHEVWSTTARLLGAGTRQDLLLALPGLLPAFGGLGGPDAMVDAADIVTSVRRWWP